MIDTGPKDNYTSDIDGAAAHELFISHHERNDDHIDEEWSEDEDEEYDEERLRDRADHEGFNPYEYDKDY